LQKWSQGRVSVGLRRGPVDHGAVEDGAREVVDRVLTGRQRSPTLRVRVKNVT
jgi:hypothetical protein